MMTAIELLERCRSARDDIKDIDMDIERYRDALVNVSPKIDTIGGSRGGNAQPDRGGELVAEIVRLEQLLELRKRQLDAEIIASCKVLDALPPHWRKLMHQYYINGESLGTISRTMHLSYSYVRKLRMSALETIRPCDVTMLLPKWYFDGVVTQMIYE